jgi:hypothetical protein
VSDVPASYVIDTTEDVTSVLSALRVAGVTGIIGYLNPLGPTSKVVTQDRARAIGAAGMTLALVSEGWGDFAHGGISAGAGERDAAHAKQAVAALGVASPPTVYFAVDTDATQAQITKLVLPYFAAIRAAYNGRVGVYGSGAVCSAVLAAKTASLAWLACSTGWAGYQDLLKSGKWALRQHLPSYVAGVSCDVNDVQGDYGAFVPFAAQDQILSANEKQVMVAQLVSQAGISNLTSITPQNERSGP